MKALIFAAGKGERMLPLTRDLPKPLLIIKNKMLIEYHLEKLARVGVSEVIVNVAWMGEKIEKTLGQGERYGMKIRYSKEPQPLETAGAIKFAEKLLGNESIIVVNADVFTDFDFASLMDIQLNEGDLGVLVMVANPAHNSKGDYFLTNDGFIQPLNANEESLTFSGISILNLRWIYDFPSERKVLPLRDVFKSAIAQKRLRGVFYRGQWSDVGTPERLAELNQA